jgi:hypothetical protein
MGKNRSRFVAAARAKRKAKFAKKMAGLARASANADPLEDSATRVIDNLKAHGHRPKSELRTEGHGHGFSLFKRKGQRPHSSKLYRPR